MRTYETMLLCDPRRSDAEIDQTVEAFSKLITDRGGTVDNLDRWGRRKLAYEMDDLTEGYYAVITYSIEPDAVKEIDAALPFLEGLVRNKTVRPEPRRRRVKA